MKTLLFLISACTALVANLALASDSNLNHDGIAGTYISDIFQRPDPRTGVPVDRSMLLTIHADGTVVSYNSQAYSKPNGSEINPYTGIQMTPSLGSWRCHGDNETIRAVFFDYFSFTTIPLAGDCLPNSCDFQVETSWNNGEYDRFTATIQFHDCRDGFYQQGNLNLQLKGIAHNDDPLKGKIEPTVCYEVKNIRIRRINVKDSYFTPCNLGM